MGIIKRADSKNLYYQFTIKGKTYVGSTRTTNKAKALQVERKKYNEIHAQVMLGEFEDVTVEAAIRQYMNVKAKTKGYPNIQACCHRLMGFKLDQRTKDKIDVPGLDISLNLHELTTAHITKLVNERRIAGYSEQTVKHEISQLRQINDMASKLGQKTNSELELPKIKVGKGKVRFLSRQEEDSLLAEVAKSKNKDNYDFVVTMLDLGTRYQEAAQLSWDRVDLDNRTVEIFRGKVNNRSTLHMTDRLYRLLAARYENRGDNQFVFMSRDRTTHKKYSPDGIDRAMTRAGLNSEDVVAEKGKATSHTLRHTHASRLVQAGMSLYEVGKLLGHADTTSTEIYAHLVPLESSKKAVDILNRI